jgi:hypothetical protein
MRDDKTIASYIALRLPENLPLGSDRDEAARVIHRLICEAVAPPQAAPTCEPDTDVEYTTEQLGQIGKTLERMLGGVAPQAEAPTKIFMIDDEAEAPTPSQHMTNSEAVQWMLNLRNGFEPETKTFRAISKAIKALELGAAEAPKPDLVPKDAQSKCHGDSVYSSDGVQFYCAECRNPCEFEIVPPQPCFCIAPCKHDAPDVLTRRMLDELLCCVTESDSLYGLGGEPRHDSWDYKKAIAIVNRYRLAAAPSVAESRPSAPNRAFVLANGDGDKFIGVVDGTLGWTDKQEEALFLVRRFDADKLAEICDDAWRIMETQVAESRPSAEEVEKMANEWRVTQWHCSAANKITPSYQHMYLAMTPAQLDEMLRKFHQWMQERITR